MREKDFVVAIDSGERSAAYVEAAKRLGISYKIVDCLATDIMQELRDADALCWHFSQGNYQDKRIAREFIYGVEKMGIPVYPDLDTCMTFDDKVAQKYVLEAIDAPLVPSYVFWNKEEAMDFLQTAEYPLVHKKAGGAGSSNVSLLKDKMQAQKVCKSRFYSHAAAKEIFGGKGGLKQRLWHFLKNDNARYIGEDKGYFYFQEYMPENEYDVRVTIIGERAVIFKRMVRDNDFRASGSGKICYEVSEEDLRAIPIAFEAAERLQLQTCAFDFVYNQEKQLKIVEMSYGFVSKAVSSASGYYTKEMTFVPEATVAEEEVLKMLQQTISRS